MRVDCAPFVRLLSRHRGRALAFLKRERGMDRASRDNAWGPSRKDER